MTSLAESVRPRLLISATIALWAAQVAALAGGLVRGKVNALELGPAGVGLVSQLNYLSTLVATVAVFGMWNGSIKLLAEARARGDREAEARVRSITLCYPLAAGLLFALCVAAAAVPIGHALLGPHAHAGAIALAGLSVPVGLVGTSLAVSLQGESRLGRLAGANAWIALGNTALVVALVVGFGLNGAIAGVLLTSVVSAAVFVAREPRLLRGLSVRRRALLDRTILRSIYAFGGAALILSLASAGTDLGIRTLIVHHLGVAANGLYQPVTMLATQLFLALIAAVGTYLFPRLTGLYASGRRAEANAEVNASVRLLLAIVVPGVILAITLAPDLLRVVFSDRFVPAGSALRWQMSGEVFRALAWTLGAVLLPLGLVRLWLGIGLATLIVSAGLAAILIGPFGLAGVSVAYSASWLVNAALAVAVGYRAAGLRLDRRTIVLAGASLASTAGALAASRLDGHLAAVAGCALVAGWLALAVPGELRR